MKPVQHIVNVSGGKDSDSVALKAKERSIDFRIVMADTGNEDDHTYAHAERLAAYIGRPLEMVRADFTQQIRAKSEYIRLVWPTKGVSLGIVARALSVMSPSGNPYLDLCLWKGRFPGRKAQFCTSELKIIPIEQQIILPALRNGPVLQWLGERSEESPHRRAKPRFNRDDTGAYLWRPIKHWTIQDVLNIHHRHNMPMNPLYSMGMSRVGCMPCINAKKSELRQISIRFPEAIERISEWEYLVAQASKRGSATFFPAVTDPMDVDRPGTYSGIKKLVEWSRTARGGRQFDLVHEMEDTTSGCHSSYGLCE